VNKQAQKRATGDISPYFESLALDTQNYQHNFGLQQKCSADAHWFHPQQLSKRADLTTGVSDD